MKKVTIISAAFLICLFIAGTLSARLDPLREIKKLIFRPNILIILDTSGSMQYLPESSTTVGGDDPRSRLYIAKNVIKSVVNETGGIVNFGFMTYHQTHHALGATKGYFPYRSYEPSGSGEWREQYFTENDLRWRYDAYHCTGWRNPVCTLDSTFTSGGITYTLRDTDDDSRYRRCTQYRRRRCVSYQYVNHDFCGDRCIFGGYTWEYRGSYYKYFYIPPPAATTIEYLNEYQGRQFTRVVTTPSGPTTRIYVYYDFSSYPLTAGSSYPVYSNNDRGTLLVPISISTDDSVQSPIIQKILAWMELQNDGGMVATGYTPTGPTLINNTADNPITERKLFTDSDATTPTIGDGTTSPPGSITADGETWSLDTSYYCSALDCQEIAWTGGNTYTQTRECLIEDESLVGDGSTAPPGTITLAGATCTFTGDAEYCRSDGDSCRRESWASRGQCYTSYFTERCFIGAYYNCELTYTFSGAYYTRTVRINWNDAYHYFRDELLPNDPLSLAQDPLTGEPCRKNLVILITDGEPNRTSSGWTDAVQQSYDGATAIYQSMNVTPAEGGAAVNIPVTTYVIGFGAETAGSDTLDNIAQNGGSGEAYFAGDEDSLAAALREIIYEAARGDYSTAPPTAATQGALLNISLLSSAKFPDWEGHLRAVNLQTEEELWDAGVILNGISYNNRRVFTSDPGNNSLIRLESANIPTLVTLGLGASSEEATLIMEFILGKDQDWKLGDIVNSVPAWVAHGPFGQYPMVYVGANDGMLHCFTLDDIKDSDGNFLTTPDGIELKGGTEVFAYIPPDLLPKLKDLYPGGQKANPEEHLYYITASPKVKIVGNKRVLVCGEGPGGYHYFALDVTQPFPFPGEETVYDWDEQFSVLWTTYNPDNTSDPNRHYSDFTKLGQTWSTPAFAVVNDQDVVIFGSGYDDINPGNCDQEGNIINHNGVGTTFYLVKALDNPGKAYPALIYSYDVGNARSCSSPAEFSLLPDMVSYVYLKDGSFRSYYSGYQAEMGGRIWGIDTSEANPNNWTPKSGTENPAFDAGEVQPFYYSPAMAVINRITVIAAASGTFDDPDLDDVGFESKIYLLYETPAGGVFSLSTFEGGKSLTDIPLDVDTPGGDKFPAEARVISSPLILGTEETRDSNLLNWAAILFLVYIPPPPNTCEYGESYLIAYELQDIGGGGVPELWAVGKISEGKASGIALAQGHLVVGESGHGEEGAGTNTVNKEMEWTGQGMLKRLYWRDRSCDF